MLSTVADVMTAAPIAVSGATQFKAIAELLASGPFAAVPVVDESGHAVGIVTESDLLLKEGHPGAADDHHILEGRRWRREREKAAGLCAGDIMTTPVHTIRADASVAEAARLLHDRRINQLPVVDKDNLLIGIVTRGDLLKTFLRSDADLVREVRNEVLVRTLWMDPDAIEVTVGSGVIRLRGTVDRRSDVQIVIRMVRELPGVVGVVNELAYSYDDRRSTPLAAQLGVLPAPRW
jgi:CBS domain-containing protein